MRKIIGSIFIVSLSAISCAQTLTKDRKDVEPIKATTAKAELDKEFDKGSKFFLKEIDSQQTENLFKLGKIWGFLKYHHPEVAKGNINWDYELFRILPAINKNDFDERISAWIKSIGNLNNSTNNKRPQSYSNIKVQPDTHWISDTSFLNQEIHHDLTRIKHSYTSLKYYIDLDTIAPKPIFKNENLYPAMEWNDSGYRLLSLFRYWNMIEYFFPYKYLIDRDWNNVLKEYIPKIISGNDELSYKLTVVELIGEIHDTHANIWKDQALTHFHGEKIAPVEINFIENKPVIVKFFDQLLDDSRLKPGDIITAINNVEIDEVIEEKIKYCPASNYPTKLRDVARRLLRTNESYINVTVKNSLGIYTEKINTMHVKEINFWKREGPSHKELNEGIGYIYPGTLKKGEIHDIMKLFLDKKGIIVDLRGYPSSFIVHSLGMYLMRKPIEFVKFTSGNLEIPGQFPFVETRNVGIKNRNYFKGKVTILVNEKTQSQAEYTAMALRIAPQTTVIGSNTAGADGNISSIRLPENIITTITGIGVYYPDGSETQRIGIVPDIEVKPTINGVRHGKDELIEKAIAVINE